MNLEDIIPGYKVRVEQEDTNDSVEGLGEIQKLVYKSLKSYFPKGATAKELAVFLYNHDKVMSNERNSVHPRLNELIKLDLVETIGKKTCQYTDKKVTIYKSK